MRLLQPSLSSVLGLAAHRNARFGQAIIKPLVSAHPARTYATAPSDQNKDGNEPIKTWLLLAGFGLLAVGGYRLSKSASWDRAAPGASTPAEVKTDEKEDQPAASVAEKALDPSAFVPFKLREVHPINHNTSLFRFDLPSPSHVLGMNVASCVVTKIPKPEGGYVFRPYTPTSDEDDRGYFDFIIKRYEGGPMSSHIHAMKPGDVLEVKGPIPKYPYEKNKFEEIGMIAGGTGIAPMIQVIRKVFKDPTDQTKISLLFANVAEEDILLHAELNRLAAEKPDRMKVYYTLDKPTEEWAGFQGYITEEMVKKTMPKPSEKAVVFVCGPPGMMNIVSGDKAKDRSQGELEGILKSLGYTKDNVYKF